MAHERRGEEPKGARQYLLRGFRLRAGACERGGAPMRCLHLGSELIGESEERLAPSLGGLLMQCGTRHESLAYAQAQAECEGGRSRCLAMRHRKVDEQVERIEQKRRGERTARTHLELINIQTTQFALRLRYESSRTSEGKEHMLLLQGRGCGERKERARGHAHAVKVVTRNAPEHAQPHRALLLVVARARRGACSGYAGRGGRGGDEQPGDCEIVREHRDGCAARACIVACDGQLRGTRLHASDESHKRLSLLLERASLGVALEPNAHALRRSHPPIPSRHAGPPTPVHRLLSCCAEGGLGLVRRLRRDLDLGRCDLRNLGLVRWHPPRRAVLARTERHDAVGEAAAHWAQELAALRAHLALTLEALPRSYAA